MSLFSSKRVIIFIAALALFMESLDATIINTAIPAIAKSIGTHPVNLKITLITYLLSLAIFTPISGWVADKFGAKKIFVLALLVFSLSSLWCGLSGSLTQLAIARFLQGVGGALSLPVARLIMLRMVGKKRFISVMAQVVMIGSFGLMLGPLLGGLISHYFSWQWIFWINLPIGVISILLVFCFLKDTPAENVEKLDKMGFLLFGFSLSGFVFSLSSLGDAAFSGKVSCLVMVFSAFLMLIYLYHSRDRSNAIVKKELFASTLFRASVLSNLMVRMGLGAIPFLVPLLLQVVLGYSAPMAGLLLVPTAVGVLLMKFFIGFFFHRFGYKRTLLFATPLTGLSLFSFALVDKGTPMALIGVLTFVFGLLMSLEYSAINSLAYIDIEKRHYSNATSLMSTLQRLSQSIGLALAALLIRFMSSNFRHFRLKPEVLDTTFFMLGLVVLMSTIIFLKLRKEEGMEMPVAKGSG